MKNLFAVFSSVLIVLCWVAYFLAGKYEFFGSVMIRHYWLYTCLVIVFCIFIRVMHVIRKDMIEHTKDWDK